MRNTCAYCFVAYLSFGLLCSLDGATGGIGLIYDVPTETEQNILIFNLMKSFKV